MFLKTGVWYFTVLLYPLGIIESILVFLGKMDRRRHFPLRCVWSAVIIFALMFFLPTYPEIIVYHIIYFLIVNIVVIFCGWIAFDVSFFSLLACCSAGLCTKYIFTSVIDIFFLWSAGTGVLWVQLFKAALNLVVCIVLFFVLPKKLIREKISYVNDKEVVIMLSVSVLFVIVFDQLSRLLGDGTGAKLVISLYSIFGASLILIMQFFMLNRNKVLREYDRVNYILEMDKKRFELGSNLTEMAKIKWHDFKHLMSLFGERADGAELDAGMQELIDSTGSCAMDAILLANVISCKKNGIKFTWFCEKDALDGVDETDIYSVFCNLIDNAKEAVCELEGEKRLISLVCSREKGGFVHIRISNFYAGELQFEDGLPVTTKTDNEVHGYGLKSVKMIAEKYDGKIHVTADGGTFEIQLLLYAGKS